ncbi:MAG: multicopper oxidase domain-containing protein [Acidimicrobiales bacterium]|nr:multicopper oxidase domain-containing protein [Acidimicrobiales bacterium]
MWDAFRSRRWSRLLAAAAVAMAVLAGLAVAAGAWMYARAETSNVGDLDFADELAIPPLAEPTVAPDGTKVFDLRFTAGETDLVDDGPTETWGLNGTYLGPTVRAERGDRVRMDVTNGVDETTTLHWHGMHLPARMDGGPHQMVEPGDTWSPEWTLDQPAATLWYHPHLDGETAEHVYRGAAGMFIVDDPDEVPDLPDTYGVDDIPLIIQDKSFDDDGDLSMSTPFGSGIGFLGDTIVVNGSTNPHLPVTTELVRLRVLNASNARVYNLGFPDGRSFWQVASDSGLLARPHETGRLQLSPGERAEIVVALEPGERTVLRSFAPDLGPIFLGGRFDGGDDTFDIVQLRAAGELAPSPPLPDRLATVDAPDAADADVTRTFSLRGTSINGRDMDMDRVDEVVTVGSTEIWEVTNEHGRPHSFHPHLVQFSVLDVDGEEPPPELAGWKDTIYVPPDTTIRIIARFDDHADPTAPFMFHCHVLDHEDRGMMGQFVVVEPGDEPDLSGMDDERGHDH